jgi:tripartite ATP-independent transporter DctP family solute receptor
MLKNRQLIIAMISLAAAGIAMLLTFNFLMPSTPETVASEQQSAPETIELRFGHNTPVDSALHQGAIRFAKLVEERSDGKVAVTVYPAQQLGNDHQMVEMARQGKLDILLTPTAKMSVPVPSMQYADLPFFFPTREDVYAMLDGKPGQMLLDDLRTIGLVGITFWENGFKHFTGNRPFLAPDDFKGTKIRVMKSRIIMDQFESFGAEPLPIDFHSTRKALADGIVDGQENPLVAIVSMGFHEVQSDLVLSEHAYLGYVFSISEKVFKTLPQNVRDILIASAKEVTPWERAETQQREQALIQTIKDAGVAVHTLTPEQKKAFAAKTAHIAKQFEPVIGVDVMSKSEAMLLEKYGPAPETREQIVIGIDADLSMEGPEAALAIKRGVELAVDEINARGGLLGKPVAILAKDHRTLTSQGIENVKSLSEREDVVAIIGGKHSAVIKGEIETIEQRRIPYLVPWAAAAEITENGHPDNYLFRISANDRFIAPLLTDHALKHGSKIAIMTENSVWGRGNIERITNHMKQYHQKAPVELVINRGQTTFTHELDTIKEAGVDVIIMITNPIESTAIIRAFVDNRVNLPIVSHWGITGGSVFNDNRRYIKNVHLEFIQSFSFEGELTSRAKHLKALYLNKYGRYADRHFPSPSATAHAYDLTHLLAAAITQAGSTDRAKVKEALEHLPAQEGVMKRYDPAFTPKRHDALDVENFHFSRFDAKGGITMMYEDSSESSSGDHH